jgi:hypothetical protein
MEYDVCTMIGDIPIENQRPWYSQFTELVEAIDAARAQHAKMATTEHYTIVREYTPTSKPTALKKADELGKLLTGLGPKPFTWVQH